MHSATFSGTIEPVKYDEFESEFPGHLATVKPATARSWKRRGEVPDSVATALRVAKFVPESVATVEESVASPEGSVAKPVATDDATRPVLHVAIPSAEDGHPEFDIMSDGLARGFAGDTWQRINRTSHAIRRMAERTCGIGTDDATALAKTMIAEWEKLRVDCPSGPDGDVCRVAVLRRVEKMGKADKKFANAVSK